MIMDFRNPWLFFFLRRRRWRNHLKIFLKNFYCFKPTYICTWRKLKLGQATLRSIAGKLKKRNFILLYVNFFNLKSQYHREYNIKKICYSCLSALVYKIFMSKNIFLCWDLHEYLMFCRHQPTFLIPEKKNKRWTQEFHRPNHKGDKGWIAECGKSTLNTTQNKVRNW